jgi:hypothetical protein
MQSLRGALPLMPMNPRLLLFLLAATTLSAGTDPAKSVPDTPQAAVAGPKATAAAADDNALELAPMRVNSTIKPEDVRKSEERVKDQLFTWRSGGTIIKHRGHRTTTELKLQFDGNHGGWDIVSLSR